MFGVWALWPNKSAPTSFTVYVHRNAVRFEETPTNTRIESQKAKGCFRSKYGRNILHDLRLPSIVLSTQLTACSCRSSCKSVFNHYSLQVLIMRQEQGPRPVKRPKRKSNLRSWFLRNWHPPPCKPCFLPPRTRWSKLYLHLGVVGNEKKSNLIDWLEQRQKWVRLFIPYQGLLTNELDLQRSSFLYILRYVSDLQSFWSIWTLALNVILL